MPDRPWKDEERQVAHLLGGRRHWANSGRRVDVESAGYVCQVKHRHTCSLVELERLAVEMRASRGPSGARSGSWWSSASPAASCAWSRGAWAGADPEYRTTVG